MNVNVRAARAIALNTIDPAERLLFLDMLGLIGRDGGIAPDSTATIDVPVMETLGNGTRQGPTPTDRDRPKQSTAPRALRSLPPLTARQRALPAHQKKQPINHGTDGGYRAHFRHKDLPPCQPCREAHTATKNARNARKRGRPTKQPREQVHGTAWAYRRELKAGLTPCPECIEAKRVADRAWARNRRANNKENPR